MRRLRPLLLALLVLALAATAAPAQTQAPTIKLPGGGEIQVKLPKPKIPKGKGKAKKKAKPKQRTNTVQLGIADQKRDMFTDPRFAALGVRIARRSVGWDMFEYDWQMQDVDDWLNDARLAGVKPLITFARSRVASKIHLTPTRAQVLDAFRKFRARYPWVTDFVATNESNLNPPGAKFPGLAAQYYNDMRKACRHCRVAAATILETPNRKQMEGWIKRFKKAAKHEPKYWALHNYYGANKFSLSGTRRMLKAVKGQIWITEVGGLVARRTPNFVGKLKMPEGLTHATKVTRFIFDRILPMSPRIKRVYLYHWNSAGPTDTWDSGLVNHDGTSRGSLSVVQAKVRRKRR
jgi:hypothetical protein